MEYYEVHFRYLEKRTALGCPIFYYSGRFLNHLFYNHLLDLNTLEPNSFHLIMPSTLQTFQIKLAILCISPRRLRVST